MAVAYLISVTVASLLRAQQVRRGHDSPASSRHVPAALIVILARLHDWPGVALAAVGLAGCFASQLQKQRSMRIARERAPQTTAELLIAVGTARPDS